MNVEVLNKIAATSSRNKKETLLGLLAPDSLRFLQLCCDPLVTFGVTVDEDPARIAWDKTPTDEFPPADVWADSFYALLCALKERRLTGGEAQAKLFSALVHAPSRDACIWATRILNKDLRAGIGVTTVNEVFPGTITPFEVALAKQFDPDKHEITGKCFVEPKLDGLRMTVIGGVPYSRGGHVFDTAGHVLRELPRIHEFVYDGEFMGATEFNADSGAARKKGTGENRSLVYNVFDIVPLEEWKARKTRTLSERKALFAELFGKRLGGPSIQIVPWTSLVDPTIDQLFAVRDTFISQGYEGAMLKLDAPYEWDRSDVLLKLKKMDTADGRIVGLQEGKGRHKGRLGALLVDFGGVTTRVGSGFSDPQRDELWKMGLKELAGCWVEVDYQNKTPDGKLRFPVYVKRREDRD